MKERTDRPGEEKGFLGRWARRKSALRRGEAPPEPAVPAVQPAVPAAKPAVPPGQDAAPPTPGDAGAVEAPEKPPLPDLDSLDENSDYSAFMSPEVDSALRRAALRKLFHSPSLNVTDGLDDYAEDYTSFKPLGDMVTSDMRFKARREAERLAREERERQLAEGADATPVETESAPAGPEAGEEPAVAATEAEGGEAPAGTDAARAGTAGERSAAAPAPADDAAGTGDDDDTDVASRDDADEATRGPGGEQRG